VATTDDDGCPIVPKSRRVEPSRVIWVRLGPGHQCWVPPHERGADGRAVGSSPSLKGGRFTWNIDRMRRGSFPTHWMASCHCCLWTACWPSCGLWVLARLSTASKTAPTGSTRAAH